MKSIDVGPQLRQGETLDGTYSASRRERLMQAVRDLSPAALKVWFVIGNSCRADAITFTKVVKGKRQAAGKAEGCWLKVASIAAASGLKDRHVRTLIAELVEKGWLKMHHRHRRSSLFWMPDGLPSARRWFARAILGNDEYEYDPDAEPRPSPRRI